MNNIANTMVLKISSYKKSKWNLKSNSPQRHLVYYHKGLKKPGNIHFWEAGTRNSENVLKNDSKRLIDYQNSRRLI